MKDESYAESVRKVVAAENIEVATLDRLKELTLVHRQKSGLLCPDDMAKAPKRSNERKWQGRVRAALMELRRNGEAALIDRAKYRFFI